MPLTIIEPGTHTQEPTTGGDGIRCPHCHYAPRKEDLWSCTCGHLWNTFDTGGVCPSCLHQWTTTCCPQCGKWSAHSEWYPRD